MSFKMIWFVLLSFILAQCYGETRKITSFVNPGCSSECDKDKNILIYVKAEGSTNTLHHFWDFSSKPTILLAVTPVNSSLSIDWAKFLKGEERAITFSLKPITVFSFVLDQIVEFNDMNNTATYIPEKFDKSNVTVYNTDKFEWKFNWDKYTNDTDKAFGVVEGRAHHEHHKGKGTVIFTLSAYGSKEHSKIQPHLLHSVNASQIDVVLKDFSTTDHFKSRFALMFSLASSDSYNSSMNHSKWRSLDDEHSPGVFTVGGIKSKNGYLEWRTVAYTTEQRLMTSSTDVKSDLQRLSVNDTSAFNHTAIFSLFGTDIENILTRNLIVSFGQPSGEDFYSKTRYLSWTFLGGIGEAVNDGFSLSVILVFIIGIGLPALLLIIGGTCLVVKRFSKHSQDIVFAEN